MSIRGAAASPMGMLMRKIQCQVVYSTMSPPRAGPTANPREDPMVTTERPNASFSGGRCSVQHIGPAAAIMAAPTAWMILNAMSIQNDVENPQKSEPAVNTARPMAMTFLTPVSAEILANMTRVPARIIMYMMVTQELVAVSTPRSSPISGRATLTILPSSPSMNVATNTTTSIRAVCLWSNTISDIIEQSG